LLRQLLQEPYFVPEGTSVNTQLNYFMQNQEQVAFVVDEYGEMLGLITMDEIIAEIIGGFNLTLATGKHIKEQADGGYLADGSVTIREFNRATSFELPVSGPRTINGLIVEYLESLPNK